LHVTLKERLVLLFSHHPQRTIAYLQWIIIIIKIIGPLFTKAFFVIKLILV
jgi:hypothetical protein